MKRFLILFAFISALAGSVLAQSGQIGVRQWKLVQLNGEEIGPSSAAYLELNSQQTRFTGNAGCNRMFASARIRGNRVDFSNIGTTKVACTDRRTQRLETDFLETLGNVDRFQRRGSSLELYVRRRLVAKFTTVSKRRTEDPTDKVRLEDKKWTLESIKGVAVSKTGRTAFLVFDQTEGSAGGNSSCNVFGGSYTFVGSSLKITDVISTMRACIEDDRMRIEREFLDGLRITNRYEIRGAKLILYQNKRSLLTFNGEAK